MKKDWINLYLMKSLLSLQYRSRENSSGFYLTLTLTKRKMKKITVRKDLMKKSDYSKQFNISRPTIDKMINNGELHVERIGTTDYIKIRFK